MAVNDPIPAVNATPTGATDAATIKTQADESKLAGLVLGMFGTGSDGIEQGASTTEFWLAVIAVGIDLAGPHFGILAGVNSTQQLIAANAIVGAYAALRSWRKRGGVIDLRGLTAKALLAKFGVIV